MVSLVETENSGKEANMGNGGALVCLLNSGHVAFEGHTGHAPVLWPPDVKS